MNTYFTSLFGTGRIKTLTAPGQTKRGSALLLTLMVVSLLMVIVLAFVVFVRLELREMTNRQNLMQARSNARLGAELAIASLQELSGPDTRVTAPILSSDPLAEPNKFLIGQVVDSSAYRRSGTGTGLVYNQNYAQTLGYFISGTDSSFDPLSYWPFEDFAQTGTADAGSALLVGPGSVSDTKDENADGVPDGYVAAPIRAIDSDETGSYAYWISDEGMKAQINITDPYLVSTGDMGARAQMATAQRMGSERVLSNYNPSDATQNEILKRSINLGQLNLNSGNELGAGVEKNSFHDVTLQSLGLPTNTRRGGLKRDLTPVMREAEANGGFVDESADQWNQLMDFQLDRMNRWSAETAALQALSGTQPVGLPDRHWNALSAITLRSGSGPGAPYYDQTDEGFKRNIFPPMSDLVTRYDQGGALWRQLITYPTLVQRRGVGDAIQSSRPWSQSVSNSGSTGYDAWLENRELTPVISKINLSSYYTMDWPDVSLHFIPYVVIWNPYSKPMKAPAAGWHVRLDYDSQTFLNDGFRYPFSLKVRNSDWNPDPVKYPHIVNDWLWTPRLTIGYKPSNQYNNSGTFVFRLKSSSGATALEIPPGEAVLFTLHEHHQVSSSKKDSSDATSYVIPNNTTIDLTAGVPSDGLYSFYVTEEVNEQVIQSAIDSSHGYMGGVSSWDHNKTSRGDVLGNPFPIYIERYPDPYPVNPSLAGKVKPSSTPQWAANEVGEPLKDIAVNETGLDDWEISEIKVYLGKGGQTGSNLMNAEIELNGSAFTTNDSNVWMGVRHPNQTLPGFIHSSATNGTAPVFTPIQTPDADEPFVIGVTPQFPTWGMSWGLRLPDPMYEFNTLDPSGSYMATPIRWLSDFNPTAPFQIRDPASRLVGGRFDRFGVRSAPMYIGGFYMGDNEFVNLDNFTYDDVGRSYIGYSDLPSNGAIPKFILYEVPEDSNDIVNVASLAHAGMQPTQQAVSLGTARDFARHSTNYGFMMPAHTIGNSMAHFLVPSDQAVMSFYPSIDQQTPAESIPYSRAGSPASDGSYAHNSGVTGSYFPGYDASWIYNEVLWDDFLFTSDYNSRIQWQGVYGDEASTEYDSRRDFTDSADRLNINGAFNINSVSVVAWATLLESMLGVHSDSTSSDTNQAAFSRFVDPPSGPFDEGAVAGALYESPEAHEKYRQLSRDQILNVGDPNDPDDDTGLAVEIVKQIKSRGPFLSLSDFVNRGLEEASNPHSQMGAIQAAIESSELNDFLGIEGEDPWLDPDTAYVGTYRGASRFYGLSTDNTEFRKNSSVTSHLMQADILSKLGSVIQARSDTFKIRSVGILGNRDNPTAQAWCEITVQRLPDFVESAESSATGNASSDLPTDLSPINQAFGRRFVIIGFRWLNKDEI